MAHTCRRLREKWKYALLTLLKARGNQARHVSQLTLVSILPDMFINIGIWILSMGTLGFRRKSLMEHWSM
jgi:hypothetical protein